MEIREYAEILERRKWVIVLLTLVTVTVVALGSYFMTPIYSASSLVRVSQSKDNRALDWFDLNYAERIINTDVHMLTSRPFLEEVIQRLELDLSPKDLADRIEVEPLDKTELIRITAESNSPREATDIANMLATLLIEQRQESLFGQDKSPKEILQEQLTLVEDNLREDRARLESLLKDNPSDAGAIQDLTSRIQMQEQTYAFLLDEYDRALTTEALRANSVTIVEPATIPDAPSKPRMKLNIAVGALVGLCGGVGLAFVFENLNPAIHSADDLEALAAVPLLGRIPTFTVAREFQRGTIVLHNHRFSPASEAFRILRSNILSPVSDTPPRTLLITSAEPGAGKSTVLANLAAAMALAGRKVVAVDTDFRHPTLHRVYDLRNELGLSNVILGLSTVHEALQATKIPGVWVLTTGPLLPKPAERLGSMKMQELLDDLAKEADVILLDSPAMLAVADASVLASMVDGVLLVAARDQATSRRMRRTLHQLDKVGAKTLGTILNRAKGDDGDFDYYSYYSDITESANSAIRS